MKRIGAALVLSLWLLATPASADESPCAAPAILDDGWDASTPGAAGFDAGALCKTLAGVAAGDTNIHAVVIERRGRLVAELYRKGHDLSIDALYGLWRPFAADKEFGPASRHDVRSISKSVVGLLVGIAVQQGEIKSLATPALDFYPEYAQLRSPVRDAVHLEHLLTMSSGFDWDEGALPNDETRLYWDWAPYRYVLSRPLVATPGALWHYDSGGTAVLADILVRTSGKSLTELARVQLFEPLGITDWEWVVDPHGRELAFTGLRMRPRDLAKVGRMALDGGRWRGRQVVPAAWIAESLRPHISTKLKSPPTATDEMHYGYQWWTGTVEWHGRKLAWSAAFGNGGQRLFVVPVLDLTVVITAGDYGSSEIAHTANRLFEQIVAAVAP